MNKVKQQVIAQNKQLSDLSKRMKRIVSKRQQELQKVDEHYSAMKKEKINLAEAELHSLKNYNKKELNDEIINKEKKLIDIKQNLDKTTSSINKQREQVIKANEAQLQEISANYFDKNNAKIQDSKLVSQKLHDEASEAIIDISKNTDVKIKNAQTQAKQELNQAHSDFDLQENIANNNFITARRKNQQKFDSEIGLQKIEHLEKTALVKRDQAKETRERAFIHKRELENTEKVHTELIKQKRLAFEQKYKRLVKSHQDIINSTTQKLEAQLSDLTSTHSSFKDAYMKRTDDSFYQLNKLLPTVVDMGDHYLINLSVADYEKDAVTLSANGRQVSLTMARDYDANSSDPDGSENKISKNEVYAKKFKVADIVDFKGIEKKFNDGILSFKVKKA